MGHLRVVDGRATKERARARSEERDEAAASWVTLRPEQSDGEAHQVTSTGSSVAMTCDETGTSRAEYSTRNTPGAWRMAG